MFTIKFYKHISESDAVNTGNPETSICHAVSCQSYEHIVQGSTSSYQAVICYPKMTTDNGVEFHINDSHPDSFDYCYVENQSGKTIASFGKTLSNREVNNG